MAATGIAAAVTAERIARSGSVSPGFFKKPFGYSVIQQRPGALPKTSRTVRNAFIPFEDAIDGDAVFVPGSALGMIIVQLGHETVESARESSFRGPAPLKFFPQFPEFSGLVRGQHSKQPVVRGPLTIGLVRRPCRIVEIRVPCIDLYDVVNQHHLHNT